MNISTEVVPFEAAEYIPCIEVVTDDKCDDIAFAIGKVMSKLMHLTLLNNELANNGLRDVRDGCPFLEYSRMSLYWFGWKFGEKMQCADKSIMISGWIYIDHIFDFNDYIIIYLESHFMECTDIGDFDLSWLGENLDMADVNFD